MNNKIQSPKVLNRVVKGEKSLINPESREEQARYNYHENARFQDITQENKRKSEV